jgi:hypothetical protein
MPLVVVQDAVEAEADLLAHHRTTHMFAGVVRWEFVDPSCARLLIATPYSSRARRMKGGSVGDGDIVPHEGGMATEAMPFPPISGLGDGEAFESLMRSNGMDPWMLPETVSYVQHRSSKVSIYLYTWGYGPGSHDCCSIFSFVQIFLSTV